MKQLYATSEPNPAPLPQKWPLTFYALLLRLYPRDHQAAFAAEMQTVFAEAYTAATAEGWGAQFTLWWRELRDLPHVLMIEHGQAAQLWFASRLHEEDPMRSDLPGVVPVRYGSWSHLLIVVIGYNSRWRRGFDIAVASCGLVLVAPLLLLLPILIKLDTKGPIFYRQQRIGKEGQPYVMYKFRSMHLSLVPQPGAVPAQRAVTDARITRSGHLTRRWHLDELPQMFNVLWGDMSIFGPRPPRAE